MEKTGNMPSSLKKLNHSKEAVVMENNFKVVEVNLQMTIFQIF
jgi:hypothetical protein